jgi:hypothetical protein
MVVHMIKRGADEKMKMYYEWIFNFLATQGG